MCMEGWTGLNCKDEVITEPTPTASQRPPENKENRQESSKDPLDKLSLALILGGFLLLMCVTVGVAIVICSRRQTKRPATPFPYLRYNNTSTQGSLDRHEAPPKAPEADAETKGQSQVPNLLSQYDDDSCRGQKEVVINLQEISWNEDGSRNVDEKLVMYNNPLFIEKRNTTTDTHHPVDPRVDPITGLRDNSDWLEVDGYGHVSVTFKHYRNPTNRKWNGKCCDFHLWGRRCRIKCNTYFKICLANAAHPNSMTGCSLANIRTSRMGHDNIYMRFTIARTFSSFSGQIGLYVEVWDWDRITKDDLVDKLSVTVPVRRPNPNGRPSGVHLRTLRGRRASLSVEFKVYCGSNYYGESCTKYCRSTNNWVGHYYCDNEGNKVCYPGWYGINRCTKHCVAHDDDVRGHFRCDSSGDRTCRLGWYGRQCKTHCISYDDDRRGHYVCDSVGKKICRTHWYGNGCKRLCRITSSSHYRCDNEGNKVCLDKWFGPSCTKYCTPSSHARCDDNGNKVCLPGWYGESCNKSCVERDDDSHGHYRCSVNGTKICLQNWAQPDCK
ncbi:hypothetical protein QZH41_014586, partial [Actinostola sp. cb2023]